VTPDRDSTSKTKTKTERVINTIKITVKTNCLGVVTPDRDSTSKTKTERVINTIKITVKTTTLKIKPRPRQ